MTNQDDNAAKEAISDFLTAHGLASLSIRVTDGGVVLGTTPRDEDKGELNK